MINAIDIETFNRTGFAIIEGFKSKAECEDLRNAANRIIDDFDAERHKSIFTTDDQVRVMDEYFKTSGDKIRCFFEAEAFDRQGNLAQDKHLSINKIGHAMHDLDPDFQLFSRDRRLSEIFRQFGNDDPRIWQSMYIFKQPRIGGAVDWHQDATFFYTEPISVLTLWFAIDDATQENGCLWVDGGGPDTPLRERFEMIDGDITMRKVDTAPWPKLENAIPLEVSAGTLVIFKGLLPHYSAPNRSSKARHAYTMHVTDGRTEYAPENWIQRDQSFPARGFE